VARSKSCKRRLAATLLFTRERIRAAANYRLRRMLRIVTGMRVGLRVSGVLGITAPKIMAERKIWAMDLKVGRIGKREMAGKERD
jgi:hypothetical protein